MPVQRTTSSDNPALQLDQEFSDGDFSFFSSDRYIFRVTAADVIKQDTGLSQAVKTCQAIPDSSNSIQLDQPSQIIRLFLSMLLRSLNPTPNVLPIEIFPSLLQFSQTVRATSVINTLQNLLPAYLKLKRSDPYYIFTSAILLRDWENAGKAIGTPYTAQHIWRRDQGMKGRDLDAALGCKTGTFALDPAGLPYHFWMEMPKKVSWALVRACAEKKGWKERGERFVVLMKYIERRDIVFPKWAAMENEHQDSDSTTSDAGGEDEGRRSRTSSPEGHLEIPSPTRKAMTADPTTPLTRFRASNDAAPIPPLAPTPPPIKRCFSPESPSPTRRVKFRTQNALFLPGPSQPQEEEEEMPEPREWHPRMREDDEEEEEELDELYDSDMELLDGP